jgi:pilus assembly protein FimV
MSEEASEDSVLSEFSFSTDPAFVDDVENEAKVEAHADAELPRVEPELRLDVAVTPPERDYQESPSLSDLTGLENSIGADALEDAAGAVLPSETASDEPELDSAGLALASLDLSDDIGSSEQTDQNHESITQFETEVPDISGLSLTPIEASDDVEDEEESEESIYGSETDPRDSKLDLARAYLDMGDDEGARPVLMEVIKEGDLAQQAEARELLLRLEVS